MKNWNLKLRIGYLLKNIRNYKYFILALILFIFSIKNFLQMMYFNYTVSIMLLPFIFIFVGLLEKIKDNKSVTRNSIFTSASIILAILFFLFQGFINEKSQYNSLITVNTHNCNVANTLSQLREKPEKFGLNYFITDYYHDNYQFIYSHYGANGFAKTMAEAQRMERINALVELTRSENEYSRIEHNKQLSTSTDLIIENFCKGKQSDDDNAWYIKLNKFLYRLIF